MSRWINIRPSMFETNSSSVHALNFGPPGAFVSAHDFEIEDDGSVHILPGEFGWEPETFHAASVKASYVYTFIKNHRRDEEQADLLQRLEQVLMARLQPLGAIRIVYATVGGYNPDGYIDHQSSESHEVCAPALASDEVMDRFIFNPAAFLQTGNDNDE